jgi:hypothetical protein
MCARALEAKGQGANRKEEEMYTGVRKQNERTLPRRGSRGRWVGDMSWLATS